MIWHAVSWHSNCATPDASRSCLPTLKLLFKTGLLASPTLAPLCFCAQALRALLVCPAFGLSCFAVRLSTNPLLYLTPSPQITCPHCHPYKTSFFLLSLILDLCASLFSLLLQHFFLLYSAQLFVRPCPSY